MRDLMRIAYADPPYLGCCNGYDHYHPDGRCWDDLDTHVALLRRLDDEFDGWALSASSTSLGALLQFTDGARVAAWVKPFAAYKAHVRVAYSWEPVIYVPARDSTRAGAVVTRDHLAEPITLTRGLTGAKPARVCRWILDLVGYVDGDELVDMYPGTGMMGLVAAQLSLPLTGG